MKVLRWVLGALVLAYAGMCAFVGGLNALHKLGQLKDVPAEVQRMVPLWDATPWWQLGVWGVICLLLLVAAWRLFTGGKAFGVMALAAVADIGLWWVMHKMPAYQAAFTPEELKMDPYILGALIVAAVLVWFTERGK